MLTYALAFLGALLVTSVVVSGWLRRSTAPRSVRSLDQPPAKVRIVVLGCPPRLRSGKPNRFFVGRIASAAAAYHHTPGRRILCSGRIGRDGIDEAAAMAEALLTASVPHAAIDLDSGSKRTLDSIEFVATNHAGEPVLFVTQPFHMPRTLFLARSRGLDAWGLIAAGPDPGTRNRVRERLAELRAIVDGGFGRGRSSCYGER